MRKNFTLLETLVTVVMILVVSTFALAGYWQLVDNARQRVCATNQSAVVAALEIYDLENDGLPAVLGQLKLEHFEKGYAKVIGKSDWSTKFAYFFVKINTPSKVYAAFLTQDNLRKYGVSEKVLHCPADPTTGVSYGMNEDLAGLRLRSLSGSTVLLADCDRATFNPNRLGRELAYRHIINLGTEKIAQVIRKDKEIVKKEER